MPVGWVSYFSEPRTIKEALLPVCGEAARHSKLLLAREENPGRQRLGERVNPPAARPVRNDGKLPGAFSRGRN